MCLIRYLFEPFSAVIRIHSASDILNDIEHDLPFSFMRTMPLGRMFKL